MQEKILIVYFSRNGNNYVDGNIIHLSIGNTKVVANNIQKITGGDLFEIKTDEAYPDDYTETANLAQKELSENARPKLSTHLDNINDYNVIFLGYPNWWGTMPMAVWTFLESYDFSGKSIAPFCTHEGSSTGTSKKDIKNLCPNSILLSELSIKGSHVNNSEKQIEKWLKNSAESYK